MRRQGHHALRWSQKGDRLLTFDPHPALACENCGDGSGWTVWYTYAVDVAGAYPVALFVACADCNDDCAKAYPLPWPICLLCEQSDQFCRCQVGHA